MNKETSSRVSTIAASLVHFGQADLHAILAGTPNEQGELVTKIRALAAFCLSQDEHAGQAAPKGDFYSRLKDERDDLDRRLIALNNFLLGDKAETLTSRHRVMLHDQSKLMSDLLAVLDERICDIDISKRSAVPETTDAE